MLFISIMNIVLIQRTQYARVAQWWSIALPRRGSRVRIPSRAYNRTPEGAINPVFISLPGFCFEKKGHKWNPHRHFFLWGNCYLRIFMKTDYCKGLHIFRLLSSVHYDFQFLLYLRLPYIRSYQHHGWWKAGEQLQNWCVPS